MSERKYIHGMKKLELEEWMKERSIPVYRASQVLDWLWKKGVHQFSEMKNIGTQLQTALEEFFLIRPLTLKEKVTSQNLETTKYVWQLSDSALVESVLIRAPGRKTFCLSSQVGCSARCSFCASGRKGLIRQLDTAEIIAQVLNVHHELIKSEGTGIDHLVYMGMGEPLENYDNVLRSIKMLTDPSLLGLSQRRITLSTVGIVEGIKRLAQDSSLRINLAISLHAPSQEIRKKIIPYARKYDLLDILEAADEYQRVSGRDLTFEYILIEGLNCEIEHAKQLVQLIGKKQCSVNLIPYNPIEGLPFQKPSHTKVKSFQEILERAHIPTSCRYTKGDDIAAACGQLALQS